MFESGSIVESASKDYSPNLEGQYDHQVFTSLKNNVASQIKVFPARNIQETESMVRINNFEEQKQEKEVIKDVFDNTEDSVAVKEYNEQTNKDEFSMFGHYSVTAKETAERAVTNNYDQSMAASLQPKEVVKSNECSKKEENTADKTAVKASEETVVAKMELKVLCKLCPKGPSNNIEYSKRQAFLKHLTLKHFSAKLLQDCPYIEGQPCEECQQKSKAFVATRKELHVCHVGIMHGRVLDLLSKDLLETVSSMSTAKK